MGSRITKDLINGSGKRVCTSWIDDFVEYSEAIESAKIYRKWAAISTIAATLEQKVWIRTTSDSFTYPHLYTFLVGGPGAGKTWAITTATNILREVPEVFFGPTSMTMAAMVNHLSENKRFIPQLPAEPLEYNTMYIVADELSAFMHEYSNELIAGLTAFYDVQPYSRSRVYTGDKAMRIPKPQLNILCGTTPSSLMKLMPEFAWDQGFTSRVLLIYSEDKPTLNLWEAPKMEKPEELIHDLKLINGLMGQFGWTAEWARAMQNWKEMKFVPKPDHPRLRWYCERRERHMMKLSMIASVDRGNDLTLNKEDFNRAFGWLIEAETFMPEIFKSGASTIDSQAMDDILHYVQTKGEVSEHQVVNFARTRVQFVSQVIKVIEVMERSGMICVKSINPRDGMRIFTAAAPPQPAQLPEGLLSENVHPLPKRL